MLIGSTLFKAKVWHPSGGVRSHNICKEGYHGNEHRNTDGQHEYALKDKDGRVQKTGIGTGEAQDGVSKRAESQLQPCETYEVVDRHAPGPRS